MAQTGQGTDTRWDARHRRQTCELPWPADPGAAPHTTAPLPRPSPQRKYPRPHPDNTLISSGKGLIRSDSFTNGAHSLGSGKRMSFGVKIREEMIVHTSLGQMPPPAPPTSPRPQTCCDLIPGRRSLQAQVRKRFLRLSSRQPAAGPGAGVTSASSRPGPGGPRL